MSKYFVFCKINGDEQPATMSRFGVSGYPTVLFLTKDANVVHKVVGSRPLDGFLQEMEKARAAGGG